MAPVLLPRITGATPTFPLREGEPYNCAPSGTDGAENELLFDDIVRESARKGSSPHKEFDEKTLDGAFQSFRDNGVTGRSSSVKFHRLSVDLEQLRVV
jgi:hypothetical protein